jgi:hypothetical protein
MNVGCRLKAWPNIDATPGGSIGIQPRLAKTSNSSPYDRTAANATFDPDVERTWRAKPCQRSNRRMQAIQRGAKYRQYMINIFLPGSYIAQIKIKYFWEIAVLNC